MIWRRRLQIVILRHGIRNNKLALLNRHHWAFPVIDDLDLPGMGEVEGHYQPVLKTAGLAIGQMKNALLHDAAETSASWYARHKCYASWESGMNKRNAWPADPMRRRHIFKKIARCIPCRDVVVFLYAYVFKLGILDGRAGLSYALARAAYIRMIARTVWRAA
jgi:hypothetical protein